MTVDVREQPLLELLNHISRAARIAIVPGADFSHHLVSIRVHGLPLEDALRNILAGYDTFFFFGAADETTAAAIRTVWVYPRGQGGGFAPIPPQMWASATELRERLTHSDPEARAAAIESLVEREGRSAQGEVIVSLSDPEPNVRARALFAGMTGGVDIPDDVLIASLSDPSVDMRFLALQNLAEGPMARAAAEHARHDTNPIVRRLAEQVLKRLTTASPK